MKLRFIAHVIWEWNVTACDPTVFKIYHEEETWYANTLIELQRFFWNRFHGRDIFHYNRLLRATVTDNQTGNTWVVNDWGRKI